MKHVMFYNLCHFTDELSYENIIFVCFLHSNDTAKKARNKCDLIGTIIV